MIKRIARRPMAWIAIGRFLVHKLYFPATPVDFSPQDCIQCDLDGGRIGSAASACNGAGDGRERAARGWASAVAKTRGIPGPAPTSGQALDG